MHVPLLHIVLLQLKRGESMTHNRGMWSPALIQVFISAIVIVIVSNISAIAIVIVSNGIYQYLVASYISTMQGLFQEKCQGVKSS